MVQVLPQVPGFSTRLGSVLGEALGDVGSAYAKQSVLESQLAQLQQAKSPIDLATSLVRLSARVPGSERYVAPLYQTLLTQMQAKQSQLSPLPGDTGLAGYQNVPPATNANAPAPSRSRTADPSQRASFSLPTFQELNNLAETPTEKVESNRFFPNNVGANQPPGNAPQPATGGVVRPVYSLSDLNEQARKLAATRNRLGIPTTLPQALEEVKQANEENKIYNKEVEEERKARVQAQRDYGKIGKETLLKVFPKATDEQQAIFAKIGENAVSENMSEADIQRLLAKEATNFKNTIASVREDISAPRLQNSIQRRLLGTQKDFNEASNDLRVKIKPLLDLGLYDTARNELTSLGYYPEEIETIINPMNQRTTSIINSTPTAKKIITKRPTPGIGVSIPTGEGIVESYDEKHKENLKDSLREIFSKDPNASLVLIRKGFEDKNYDWRIFKNTLNEMLEENEIKLNGDQRNQLKYLDTPPLNLLDKFLHSLKIIGR